MKSGKQILALTILSLGVYRFSQTFLMQQVQKVSAADTAVGKENSGALTGNELNITVKNYPTKVIESSSDSQSSSSSAQTEQPVSKTQPDQQTTNQSTTTAQQVPAAQQDQSKTANTQEVAEEQQRAAQKATNASDKSTAAQSVAQTTQDQAKAAEATTANTAKNTHKIAKKTIKKHANASIQEHGNQQGQDNANQDQQQADFLKHHAQVEKDIAMFQQSMSPNTPSGGATTQVGAVFGALAGQGVYAVQNEIE
ncbi:hypothetical protein [Latilactobacillus sakei]|uniref:hypothetical protein n=1 Tax=Latilactobacillus sakei TaxID=1599 RepID=UPI000C1288CB|nr:hypothetical protein [Latilactobacillus sakei]SON72342.1 conserved exported protein of unknown function [Latilactobacillus sakei]